MIDGGGQPDPFLVGDTVHRQTKNTPRAKITAHILMLGPAHVRQVTGGFEKPLEFGAVARRIFLVAVLALFEQRPQQRHQGLWNAGEPVRGK